MMTVSRALGRETARRRAVTQARVTGTATAPPSRAVSLNDHVRRRSQGWPRLAKALRLAELAALPAAPEPGLGGVKITEAAGAHEQCPGLPSVQHFSPAGNGKLKERWHRCGRRVFKSESFPAFAMTAEATVAAALAAALAAARRGRPAAASDRTPRPAPAAAARPASPGGWWAIQLWRLFSPKEWWSSNYRGRVCAWLQIWEQQPLPARLFLDIHSRSGQPQRRQSYDHREHHAAETATAAPEHGENTRPCANH